MTRGSRQALAAVALVLTAGVWGSTFIMVKGAVAAYPLYAFLGWRFGVAVVAFLLMFPGTLRRFAPGTLRVGLVAGAFMCAGYVFQTWGLESTTASKSAFITGMFVVITPLLQAVVLRRPPRLVTLAGVGLAVAGLWLLSGGSTGGWSAGDSRTLLAALAYSAHMIVLGGPGRRHDPRALTLVQLGTIAVVCGVLSAASEHAALPSGSQLLVALAVTGVLASAVAFGVQTTAQRVLSPTKTALILILEPVFGGLFGWMAGEKLGTLALAGSALILGGMLLAEVVGSAAASQENAGSAVGELAASEAVAEAESA